MDTKLFRAVVFGLFVVFVSAFLFSGCGPSIQAPVQANGQPVVVMIYVDRSITSETPAGHAERLDRLGQIIEENLSERLQRMGYATAIIPDRNQYQPAPGQYLIAARVVNYINAFVSATLHVDYEAIGPQAVPIYSTTQNATTTRGWQRLVANSNANAALGFHNALVASLPQ